MNLMKSLPPTFKYEASTVDADGDVVIMHRRFSGIGLQRNWIAADVVRIENGVLAEHRDVIQDEVTKVESKSGLQTFGELVPE